MGLISEAGEWKHIQFLKTNKMQAIISDRNNETPKTLRWLLASGERCGSGNHRNLKIFNHTHHLCQCFNTTVGSFAPLRMLVSGPISALIGSSGAGDFAEDPSRKMCVLRSVALGG